MAGKIRTAHVINIRNGNVDRKVEIVHVGDDMADPMDPTTRAARSAIWQLNAAFADVDEPAGAIWADTKTPVIIKCPKCAYPAELPDSFPFTHDGKQALGCAECA